MTQKAILVLEDGTTFEGTSLGASGRAFGEVVFNTSMTGYQEILTDPSYRGQMVTMTYPLIGNYGTSPEDFESRQCQVSGFIVSQECPMPSSWRSQKPLQQFLAENGVVGIQGIDTRALTRRLRTEGVMMGTISTDETPQEALQRLRRSPKYSEVDFVEKVSTPEPYLWKGYPADLPPDLASKTKLAPRVVVVDYGVKFNILRILAAHDCEVIVVPCRSTADQVLQYQPDGILLSPGPGDPVTLPYGRQTVEGLLGRLPMMGICMGHQLLGWALGGKLFKLKFGHHGGNHPVKDLTTGRVYITAQNHGYALEEESLKKVGAEVSHLNLNDDTVEGLRHKEWPVFSVQYHGEGAPGPEDSRYLFDEFVKRVNE